MAGHVATADPVSAPLALHGQSVEGVNRCVHCGLCLAYCPTFSLLGTEMDSPRGRIFLIKSLAEGRIALTDNTVKHLDLCLGCRACETVCPSGVPYGRADRGGARRDRAPAPRRSDAPALPPRQFRVPAAAPENAGARGGGPALLSGERAQDPGAGSRGRSSSFPVRWRRGSRFCPSCRRREIARRVPEDHAGRGRQAGAESGCSPDASSRWPSARRTTPPRACCRRMAPRSWRRGIRPAAARSTRTAASTRWRWTSRGARSRPSSPPASTTSS